MSADSIEALETPCLLLDQQRFERNVASMELRCRQLGVAHRAHLKTAKSFDVARRIPSVLAHGATVSTVTEAEYFATAGVADLLYAVCVEPRKLPRLARVVEQGVQLHLAVDDLHGLGLLADAWPGLARGAEVSVFVEVDSGEHRSGVAPDAAELLRIVERIDASPGLRPGGVFTHAGHSYSARDPGELRGIAEQERVAATHAAERIRGAGLPCEVVSVGSTPTAVHAARLDGITELRAGVYVFGDAFQAAIGSCTLEDVALTVLTTVIGSRARDGRLVVDAGGLALSKDRSTASLGADGDIGYGLVATCDGTVLAGARIVEAHQEHGLVELPQAVDAARFPVGSQLRIVPNHACMTAAAHSRYHVIGANGELVDRWARVGGWE